MLLISKAAVDGRPLISNVKLYACDRSAPESSEMGTETWNGLPVSSIVSDVESLPDGDETFKVAANDPDPPKKELSKSMI